MNDSALGRNEYCIAAIAVLPPLTYSNAVATLPVTPPTTCRRDNGQHLAIEGVQSVLVGNRPIGDPVEGPGGFAARVHPDRGDRRLAGHLRDPGRAGPPATNVRPSAAQCVPGLARRRRPGALRPCRLGDTVGGALVRGFRRAFRHAQHATVQRTVERPAPPAPPRAPPPPAARAVRARTAGPTGRAAWSAVAGRVPPPAR